MREDHRAVDAARPPGHLAIEHGFRLERDRDASVARLLTEAGDPAVYRRRRRCLIIALWRADREQHQDLLAIDGDLWRTVGAPLVRQAVGEPGAHFGRRRIR